MQFVLFQSIRQVSHKQSLIHSVNSTSRIGEKLTAFRSVRKTGVIVQTTNAASTASCRRGVYARAMLPTFLPRKSAYQYPGVRNKSLTKVPLLPVDFKGTLRRPTLAHELVRICLSGAVAQDIHRFLLRSSRRTHTVVVVACSSRR